MATISDIGIDREKEGEASGSCAEAQRRRGSNDRASACPSILAASRGLSIVARRIATEERGLFSTHPRGHFPTVSVLPHERPRLRRNVLPFLRPERCESRHSPV